MLPVKRFSHAQYRRQRTWYSLQVTSNFSFLLNFTLSRFYRDTINSTHLDSCATHWDIDTIGLQNDPGTENRQKPHKMQCGLESLNDCERSPNRTNLRVNFTEKGEAVKERREKFLTAKYGSHQMSLIRKRLAVEMWLYDELQKLFDPPVSLIHQ